MQSSLAVVILNYNGAAFLKKFLPSVIAYSKPHRIIVADNASTDYSINLLKEEFPEVERVQLVQNWGFAGGYNKALEQITADYFLLLNSDVEVTAGWIDPLLLFLEKNPVIAACQPKVLAYHQPTYFEYAGGAGGFLDWLAYPFCRGRIFDTLEQDLGQYQDNKAIFWATGACMLIKADIFKKMGGFDEDFFAHMEEIDLCWRMHTAGYQVWACPESKVYHVGGGTLPKESPRKTYLNFRNGLWMLIKNSGGELWFKLPLRVLLDWVVVVQFLLKGNRKAAKAVLKAHKDTIKSVENLHRKRSYINKNKKAIAPLFSKLIILEYFFKKKKHFSQLNN